MVQAKNPYKVTYNKETRRQIEFLLKKGFTDEEVAEVLGCAEQTIYKWKNKYPEFFKSVKDWKDEADVRVERSMYERAVGYSAKEDKIFCNAEGKVTIVRIEKHYPPDVTAQIFWLKNRQKEHWRDRWDIDATGDLTVQVVKFADSKTSK